MLSILIPLAIYWLVCFVVCFVVVEYGQSYLYDEVTPGVGWKVGVGSLILAGLLTWARPSFETMFTSDIAWTLLQAVVWFAVFTLLFQFHPPHALGLSLATFILFGSLATLAVDNATRPRPVDPQRQYTGPPQRIRRPVGAPPAPDPDAKAAPEGEGEAAPAAKK